MDLISWSRSSSSPSDFAAGGVDVQDVSCSETLHRIADVGDGGKAVFAGDDGPVGEGPAHLGDQAAGVGVRGQAGLSA